MKDQGRRPSRRRFLAASAGVAAIGANGPAPMVLSAQNAAPFAEDVTLALVNGKIHTMDARNTVASGVTIRNGRFVSVGGKPPKAGPGVRVIDLRGHMAVAGLVEPHIHIVSLGNRPGYHTILENTASIREIQQALAARRKDVPAGAWITSMGGWHPNQWAEHRHPTLAELDEAVPDRPVLLYERFTGPAATNTLGKAFFDASRCRAARTSGHQEDQRRREWRHRRGRIHRRRSVGFGAFSPAPDADLRRQEDEARSMRCGTRPVSG